MRANNQQYTKKNKLIVGYNNYSLITAWLIYYQSQIFPRNQILKMDLMLNLPIPRGVVWTSWALESFLFAGMDRFCMRSIFKSLFLGNTWLYQTEHCRWMFYELLKNHKMIFELDMEPQVQSLYFLHRNLQ